MTRVVKICGLKTIEAAEHAIEAGADLLGVILVPNRARTADHDIVREISLLTQAKRTQNQSPFPSISAIRAELAKQQHTSPKSYSVSLAKLLVENGPFLVGVFRNQDLQSVLHIAKLVGLDFIQLHGSEDKIQFTDAADKLGLGTISRYVVPQDIHVAEDNATEFSMNKYVALQLLDSEAGGEGKVIDWDIVDNEMGFGQFILAGGLTPHNLENAAKVHNILGFDVSGGVEDASGNKDNAVITSFIDIGKSSI